MTAPDVLQRKFQLLRDALCSELVERDGDIDAALRALLSSSTLFLIGEPGVAKSLLARRLSLRITGGEYFDLSLDKFSTPEDVFGPRSLEALKQGRWAREHEGTLATADWAMLDEFFEASTALLKTLLRPLNEREVRQGVEVIPMPLSTLFAAANQAPTEPRLMPLYDRLLLRRQVRRIQDDEAFTQMLAFEFDEKPKALLRWSELAQARAQVDRVMVPPALLTAIAKIRAALANEEIRLSDRRFKASVKVVRATAWLDGEDTADASHLRCLYDICWSQVEQIEPAWRVIDMVLDPILLEFDKLAAAIRELSDQVQPVPNERARRDLANELYDKLMQAERDLDALERSHTASPRRREKLTEMRKAMSLVSRRIATELFEVVA